MSEPLPRPFDLGASAFVDGTRFILARGNWKSALAFTGSATTTDPASIAFDDVRTAVLSIQSDAGAWTSTTYPKVVGLASAVVDFGANKVPVYLVKLAKVVKSLGDDPTNATLLQQFEAIAEVLARSANEARSAATASATDVAAAGRRQRASERQLASVVAAYSNVYRTSQPAPPALPDSLDATVTALGDAWDGFTSTLDALVQFARTNAKDGRKFTVDVGIDAAVVEWRIASAAANDFRTSAFITTPALVA